MTLTIGDIFTTGEIRAAIKLHSECRPGEFNRRVVQEVVQPSMDRIDRRTGQKNDARYLGYLLEMLINCTK